MVTSRFMKWLLCLNVGIWVTLNILDDFTEPRFAMWLIIFFALCKTWVASQVCVIIAMQPEPDVR